MKVTFKENDCKESQTPVQKLRQACVDFITNNHRSLDETSVSKRVSIESNKVKLTFPSANVDWTGSIALLIVLLSSSGKAYVHEGSRGYIISTRDLRTSTEDLVELVKNNMNAEISICK